MKSRAFSLEHCFIILSLIMSLSACGTAPSLQRYDFGGTPASTIDTSKTSSKKLQAKTLLLAELRVPVQLDGDAMLYRLNYENTQELRAYAQNRWSTSPAQLLAQTIKQTINREGGNVAEAGDGVRDLPQIRIELEEFAQHFTRLDQSQAQIHLRVSLIHKNQLIGQQRFSSTSKAPSADAKGGAQAMAKASQELADQLVDWLQGQLTVVKMP